MSEFTEIKSHLNTIKLYPGIDFAQISLPSKKIINCSHGVFSHIIVINYCISGNLCWKVKDGSRIFLEPGDFSLHSMDICCQSVISSLNSPYAGIIIYLDLKELQINPPEVLKETDITYKYLYDKFCKENKCTALKGNKKIKNIFDAMYSSPSDLQLSYQKIKAVELILELYCLELNKEKKPITYKAKQIEIIKAIHDRLCNNMANRISIEALSHEYPINSTTMKVLFKYVYGKSIAAHINEHRMERAGELLTSSSLSIAQIASLVGYSSQSKFSAAFQKYFKMNPRTYRSINKKTTESDFL